MKKTKLSKTEAIELQVRRAVSLLSKIQAERPTFNESTLRRSLKRSSSVDIVNDPVILARVKSIMKLARRPAPRRRGAK